MSVLIRNTKVKKKKFTFLIPDFLNKSIDDLIQACNTNDSLADCYMDDLYNNINNCLHLDLTEEQAAEIRDYYINGGMYDECN